jgi:acetyltransferase-like isoleucine patch superfamily enzyme
MNFIHDTATCKDCVLGDNIKVYARARLRNSTIDDCVSVGDESSILKSTLKEHLFIQRYNDLVYAEIGKYTCTGRYDVIHCATIGAFCSISWDVSIGGDNHNPLLLSTHPFYYQALFGMATDPKAQEQELLSDIENEPCIVGNDVWIAAGVKVNRNLTIGDGAIIGANSTVTRDIPPYAIAVGSPAKVIKMRFDKGIIDELEQIKWWEFPDDILKANLDLFKSPVNSMHIDTLWKLKESQV